MRIHAYTGHNVRRNKAFATMGEQSVQEDSQTELAAVRGDEDAPRGRGGSRLEVDGGVVASKSSGGGDLPGKPSIYCIT